MRNLAYGQKDKQRSIVEALRADSTRKCNSIYRNREQAAVASVSFVPARMRGNDEHLHAAYPTPKIPDEALLKAELNQTEIAEILNVHKSTISRELKRNKELRRYRTKQAQHLADGRQGNKAQTRIVLNHMVID